MSDFCYWIVCTKAGTIACANRGAPSFRCSDCRRVDKPDDAEPETCPQCGGTEHHLCGSGHCPIMLKYLGT